MSLTITFIGQPSIKHLNLRKEGDEHDKVLAVDVKLEGEVKSDVLNDLFGASPGDDFRRFFWNTHTTEEINAIMQDVAAMAPMPPEPLKTYQIEEISISGTWKARLVTLGKTEIIADVGKVHVTPLPGLKLAIALQIQVENPSKPLLDYLVSHVQDTVNCVIESQPELPLKAKAK